ncbi:hypothetical protein PBI_INGRID_68 [Arthrobacter phage Ingrid]|nr:hypothetical protein PBI_INGRID_68 [Arthrobacter phage Ingrid]QFG11047.1 hypothetical protein PBI_LORETTA_65 [Arthrobacter phage Loretta]
MARYRQKPEIVDARQFTGGQENAAEIIAWLKAKGCKRLQWVDNQTVLDIHLVERLSFASPGKDTIIRSAYRKDYIVNKGDSWRIFPERKFLERFESI